MKTEEIQLNHLALNAVKANKNTLFLLAVFLLLCGCVNPSADDNKKMGDLHDTFGDRYIFKLEDGLYIHAQLRKEAASSDNDAEEIYKAFRFINFDKRVERSTSYVYLNMFDSAGHFLFQLTYDPQSQKFVRGNTPHY